ncbi:MAG TPA: hypothetical protein VFA27_14960 [Vicinamibacterales bacterium]|nr:hypothetical protein [Vicinamibacterales bacterium]
MYSTVLLLHSWIRWVAFVGGVGTTLAALMNRERPAEGWSLVTMIALDIQLLLGLLLYLVVSPNMKEITAHFGESMQNPQLRFWAVEHVSAMLVAIILAHVGRAIVRKAQTPGAKRGRLLVCFGLATIMMIVGMPWPGARGGRPLFRF